MILHFLYYRLSYGDIFHKLKVSLSPFPFIFLSIACTSLLCYCCFYMYSNSYREVHQLKHIYAKYFLIQLITTVATFFPDYFLRFSCNCEIFIKEKCNFYWLYAFLQGLHFYILLLLRVVQYILVLSTWFSLNIFTIFDEICHKLFRVWV